MARIDLSTIEGYENMTAEEKLKALEGYDVPAPDYTGYVKKEQFDKTASDLAAAKKQLREKMTEDEANKQKEQEAVNELQTKYDALLKETTLSKNTAKFLSLGYEEKLAAETAKAMLEGDTEKVFANQQKHLESVEKRVRADVLKDTPRPVPDGGSGADGQSLGAKYASKFNATYAAKTEKE